MAEVMDEVTYVKHHKRKIAFLFAAMRHFAKLRAAGDDGPIISLMIPAGPKSLLDAVELAAAASGPGQIVVTAPGEYRLLADIEGWQGAGDTVEILPIQPVFMPP